MAEEGDLLGDSLILQSDDFHEYPCLPCANDNRNVAAVKYCVECDENICGTCVAVHSKYAGLKGHQISNKIKTHPDQGGPGLPIQRCDTHAGKLMDVYCSDHDFVGCSACIAIEHRICEDVKFIPDIVTTHQTNKELHDLNYKIQEVEMRIDALKKLKAKCVENLKEDKKKILQEMSSLRKKINNRLDHMETTMLKQVDTIFQRKNEVINSVVSEISSVSETVQDIQASLSAIADKNASALFVEVKKSKTVIDSNADTLKLLEDSHLNVSIGFYPSREIEHILQITSSLAYLSDTPVLSSKPIRSEHMVRLETDEHKCEIRNICLTKNCEIALTDIANMSVKIFDTSFVPKEYIVTPGQPFDVCEVDDLGLAITLHDKQCVQFVSQNPLKLEKSICVGDNCRGIKYNAGKLYVGCGGFASKGERPGHIEVYDIKGTLLMSCYECLVCPWYVNISVNQAKLFMSDFVGQNVISFDLVNNSTEVLELPNVIRPAGFCSIAGTKQLLVCDYGSNNILIKSAGEPPRSLISAIDGLVKPRGVVFDTNKLRLMVSLDKSDFIQVYTFKD